MVVVLSSVFLIFSSLALPCPFRVRADGGTSPMTIVLHLLALKAAASCSHLPPLCSCSSCLNDILPSYPKMPTFLFLIPVQCILVFHFVPHLSKDDIWDGMGSQMLLKLMFTLASVQRCVFRARVGRSVMLVT